MTVTGEELRVRSWDQYVGQADLKANLSIRIRAALNSGRPLDHILLSAPPGYGKTSLCGIIAVEMNIPFWFVKMTPGLAEKEFLRMIAAAPRPVLFLLDEIHSTSKTMQEMLLPALEEGFFQSRVGKMIPCEGMTIVGATTEPSKLIKPLLDRFHLKPHFVDYTDDELAQIILSMAHRIGMYDIFPPELAYELAPAAAFTPRVAGSLVLSARDLRDVGQELSAGAILDLAGLDHDGLTPEHLDYLRALDELGGTSGMRNLASLLQKSAPQIETIERLLIKRGLLTLESAGRTITGAGMMKIGVQFNARRSA